jgi:zinc protease
MIDRKTAPILQEINQLQLVAPEKYAITEQVPLYYLENKHSEGFKLDIYFNGGFRSDNRLLAKMSNKLILSGTSTKTSTDIDNQIDVLGGFTGQEHTSEDATISVLGQNKYFHELSNIVLDAIANAAVPSRDFNQVLATEKQRFIVQQQKVSTQARRLFLQALYSGTFMSKLTETADYDMIDRQEVIDFIAANYKKGLLKVTLIGNISAKKRTMFIQQLQQFCGPIKNQPVLKLATKSTLKHHEILNKVQSAIRIGKPLFNRTHEDYPKFVLLNTLLGGYFGSRLMKNIREDKGLTYGIGSGIAQAFDHGYFFISTEVNKEKREEAIELILAEIELLQQEKVSEEELRIVKNYSIGQLLKNSDGPFAQMDRFLAVEKLGMSLDYYTVLLQAFKSCTADDIITLASRHLNRNDIIVCSAG